MSVNLCNWCKRFNEIFHSCLYTRPLSKKDCNQSGIHLENISVHSSPEWIDMVQRVEQLEKMVRNSGQLPLREGFLISADDLVIGTESLDSSPDSTITDDSTEFIEEDIPENDSRVVRVAPTKDTPSPTLPINQEESIGSLETVQTESSWCEVDGRDISSGEETQERT